MDQSSCGFFGLLNVGFDPMAGIIHADKQNHNSFAYAVMEVLRPEVDDWLLEFIQHHEFAKKDFYEKKDGGIRLTLRITLLLEKTVPQRSDELETILEEVKVILLEK